MAVKCSIAFGSELRVPEDLKLTTPLKRYGSDMKLHFRVAGISESRIVLLIFSISYNSHIMK